MRVPKLGPAAGDWVPAGVVGAALIGVGMLVSPYDRYLLTSAAIVALPAIGVQFLFRRPGELSFGHSLFFGLGAYGVALPVSLTNGGGLGGLAWLGPALLAAPLAAGLLGLLAGRHTGVYFTIITLAAAEAVRVATAGAYGLTGGDNGIHGLPVAGWAWGSAAGLVVCAGVLSATLGLLRMVSRSHLGRALEAARQSPLQAAALGLDPYRLRVIGLVISAIPAGVGGTLAVLQDRAVHPRSMSWTTAGEYITAVLLAGGGRSATGVVVSSVALTVLKAYAASWTLHWPSVIAACLLASLFLNGVFDRWRGAITDQGVSRAGA